MTHGSLFSGMGGFDLAAEWMGWDNIFHCEWNEFGQKILKYYWPKAISYADIKKTDFTIHRGKIDILTGGFPCQPYSNAGKRKGTADDRHLWPEMLRAIREIQPPWIVGENVRGLTNWSGGLVFDEVQAEMETEGYEVLPFLLPACAVNAPHRRDRIWFIAHSNSSTKGSSRKSRCPESDRCKNYDEQKKRRIEGKQCVGCDEILRSTSTNSNNTGAIIGSRSDGNRTEENQGRQEQSQSKFRKDGWDVADTRCDNSGSKDKSERTSSDITGCSKENATHPDSNIGCQRGMYKEGQQKAERYISSQNARSYQRNTWDIFPTQSPICNGDDGLSSRLDGITFPKWRNESIKAGGNAIVPQVAYEIFKCINLLKL